LIVAQRERARRAGADIARAASGVQLIGIARAVAAKQGFARAIARVGKADQTTVDLGKLGSDAGALGG
jgi:hypothetical protein